MKAIRNFRLTTIILSISMGILMIVSVIFIYTGYINSQRAIHNEIQKSFEYRESIARLTLQQLLGEIATAVTIDIQQFTAAPRGDRGMLEALKENMAEFSQTERGSFVDILAIADASGALSADLSSALFPAARPLLEHYLEMQPGAEQWQLVVLDQVSPPRAALMYSSPVIEETFGQVLAYVVSGVMLNNNVPVLNRVKSAAGVAELQLLVDHQVVASTSTDSLASGYLQYLKKWPYSDASHNLSVALYVTDEFTTVLVENYRQNVLILLLVSVLAALLMLWLLRRITTTGFGRLMEYVHQVSHGREAELQLGSNIVEFKRLSVSLKRMVSHLNESKEQVRLLSKVVDQSPVSVVITDPTGNIEYVNDAFVAVTGFSFEEVHQKSNQVLFSSEATGQLSVELARCIEAGEPWQGELLCQRKNGEEYWGQVYITAVKDDDGRSSHLLEMHEDITLRKQQEEKILHQAHFDSLTNLPNRFLSLDRLHQLISEARRYQKTVATLYLDLDNFKNINDTLGHEAGDQLLVKAAERLKNVVREGDTVGRLGGDEFLIILGGLTQRHDVEKVTFALLEQIQKPFEIKGRSLKVSGSIGITMYPGDGDTPSQLLRNADAAMYHAKHAGKNTFAYFTDSMNQKIKRRFLLEEKMHDALQNEEFSIAFQPKVEMDSGQIIGAEALLRWHNDELGPVSPEEFIPIAEQTGMIIELGYFVLQQSLQITAQWRQQFQIDFQIAVNLSPAQFRDDELIPRIQSLLGQYGLEAKVLELEITEGVLMNSDQSVSCLLDRLHELGIKIAMDDFGTGYSSLSYLRRYPFDILKIDRTFVRDIGTDPADRELVNATISMAHGLSLKVVAEGVETAEQLDYLARRECDFAQGYYFSKPVAPAEFGKLLEQSRVA